MIQIITDSAADFEAWELKKMNIICIPLHVIFGQREYRETVDLTMDQFYTLLLESGEFPKTAQSSPQVLIDLLEQAKQDGDEVVYIPLSSQISGAYTNGLMLKEMQGYDHLYVVDSRNGTGGQRMVVEQAVRLRAEGKTAAEIAAGLEAMRHRVKVYACMDTLEYLYRGGRISHTTYAIGSVAQIKPILHMAEDGSVTIPTKVIGTRRGMDYLCRQVEQRKLDPDFPFYVMYTSHKAPAEVLAERLKGAGVPVERIIQVGAAIGTHVGPGACGFVYVCE